jgi:hypothetical protein
MSTLFPGAGDDGASWQAGAAAAPPAHARFAAGPRGALEHSAEHSAEHRRNRRRLCRLRADPPRRPPGSRRGRLLSPQQAAGRATGVHGTVR